MFKGFNLKGFDESFINTQHRASLKDRGRQTIAPANDEIQETLTSIAKKGAVLDGEAIKNSWFPQVHADVFLSHSHRDEDLVLMLAGWLDERFGLKAFIDSAIWRNAADLLRIIDNRYCWQPNSQTYNYLLRNESTSHVHMMLMTALGMMIHKTECLIFVNTPESIFASSVVKDRSLSPWIYAELTIAGIVEELRPKRLERRKVAAGGLNERRELNISYAVQGLGRLNPITSRTLSAWDRRCNPNVRGVDSLDVFYDSAAGVS